MKQSIRNRVGTGLLVLGLALALLAYAQGLARAGHEEVAARKYQW